MWRLNLTAVQVLNQDPYHAVSWECVKQSGDGPGKISHHTASPQQDTVTFFGGLKGEDSVSTIYIFEIASACWSKVALVSNLPSLCLV